MPSGVYIRTEENRKNIAEAVRKLWQNPEYRNVQENSCPMNKRGIEHKVPVACGEGLAKWIKEHPEEHRQHCILGGITCRDSDEFQRFLSGQGKKPTSIEKKLSMLLEEYFPNEWKYVGDGQVLFGNKNPDFMNVNGQKMLIELFGDYWHKGEDGQDRIKHFVQYGFQTLIIWEHELGDCIALIQKIEKFTMQKGGTQNS